MLGRTRSLLLGASCLVGISSLLAPNAFAQGAIPWEAVVRQPPSRKGDTALDEIRVTSTKTE